MSLRHIAVLASAGDVRVAEFSLHDLRSIQGFTLEQGESALAATISRFGVVLFGPYMLFCFATGIGVAWKQSAGDTWVALGGKATAVCPKNKVQLEPLVMSMGSYVSAIQGPLRTSDELLKGGEEQVVELRVRAGERVDRLALGASALQRGVLVGRSDRCTSILGNPTISRVHVLVIALDGEVVAVDTASTGGVFRDREATVLAQVVMMSRGERAALVDEDASVSLR